MQFVCCLNFSFIVCVQLKVDKHKLTWDWNPQPILMHMILWLMKAQWGGVAQGCCLWMIYQFIWLKKRYYTWPQRSKGQRGWRVSVRLNDVFALQIHSRGGDAAGEAEDGSVSSWCGGHQGSHCFLCLVSSDHGAFTDCRACCWLTLWQLHREVYFTVGDVAFFSSSLSFPLPQRVLQPSMTLMHTDFVWRSGGLICVVC